MKTATAKSLLAAKKFFDENPDGKIKTGLFNPNTFNKEEFQNFFIGSLLIKCGGSELTERQFNKMIDSRIINDYCMNRICRSGSNILRDPKLQKKYPHINTRNHEII